MMLLRGAFVNRKGPLTVCMMMNLQRILYVIFVRV